ncbi:MAG: hypothetical protein HDS92_04335 [Bacteroidales bacterium]|nr:hypothetical protein [Bacteroidales bacterium]
MRLSLLPGFIAGLLVATTAAEGFSAEPSGTLPVLYIETPDHQPITSKETYISNTSYWLDPKGDPEVEALGSKEAPLTMQIRGRGNYTWTGFDKKPYRLKLDSKQPIMGMDKSKHWALMAHADDNLGFLRAPITFKLSELTGLAWTPQQRPLEVVLNGDYIGLYFLTQTVRVDKDRVDIVEQADNSDADVTGGWLLEIDNYQEENQLRMTEGDGSEMWITYKSPEVLCDAQYQYLKGQMEALNNAFYQQSPQSNDWEKLADKEALAAYYLVQEMTDNYESFHGSCYFTRNVGADCLWTWGPVWDTGSTFMRDPGQFMYDSQWHQTWIPQIVKFDSFKSAYTEAMKEFLDNHYGEVAPYIRNYAARIAEAARHDAERWPQYGNPDVEADCAKILSLWSNRVMWLSEQWGIEADVPRASGIYLRGDMNGWGTDAAWEFTTTATKGVYELTDVTLSGSFKIADKDWGSVNYGRSKDGSNPVADEPFLLTQGTDSQNMQADGSYVRVVFTMTDDGQATLLLSTEEASIDSTELPSATIQVSGNTVSTTDGSTLRVYTLQGALTACGSSVSLPAGMYIAVSSSCGAKKVAIK